MADVPQYRPRADLPGQLRVSAASAAPGLDQLYATLGEIKSKIDANLDQVAAQEGDTAGGLAGMKADFRPSGDPSIRGQAYDRAGLRVALSRMEVDAQSKADAAWAANKDDPAALQASLDKARSDTVAELQKNGLGAIAPDVSITFDRLTRAHMANAATLAEQRMADADRASLAPAVDASMDRISQLAYAGQSESVVNETNGLMAKLIEHGPRGAFDFLGKHYDADPNRGGTLDLVDIQKIATQATESAGEATVLGRFASARSIPQMEALKAKFDADFKSGKLPFGLPTYERLSNKIDADISGKKAEARAAGTALSSTIADQVRLLGQGFKPAADLNSMMVRARAMGRPDLADNIEQAKTLYSFQDTARRMSPYQLQQWIDGERKRVDKSGATEFDAARITLGEKLLGTMQTELKQDPLEWASRAGAPVADIQFEKSPTTGGPVPTVDSLRHRLSDADAVAAHYGTAPVYLKDTEATTLAATLDAAPPQQKLEILGAFAQAAPDDRLPVILSQIAVKAPAIAQAGVLLADGNSNAAGHIAAGVDLLKAQPELAPTPSAMRDADADMLNLIRDPAARAAVQGAGRAIYAASASKIGADVKGGDPDLYRKSLNEALGARVRADGKTVGGFGELNGSNVILPNDMSEDEAHELIGSLNDQDLIDNGAHRQPPVDIHGKPIPAEAIRDAYPVTIGPGRYAFSSTDPASQVTLYGAKTPEGIYILDLPALGKRRAGVAGDIANYLGKGK